MATKARTNGTRSATASKELLLRLLDEAYDKTGWTDRTLRRSLRGVGSEEAAWRPGPDRHNIWEYVVHVAWWKHVLRGRILGRPIGDFPEPGEDFFRRDDGDDRRAWERDRRLLAAEHEGLREAVAGARTLTDKAVDHAIGAAFHDVYHGAQIELLRRLAKGKARA